MTHMSMLLQKGGDFMTLIKTPFKKKRSTVAGDGKRSPSMTPRSARGSTGRSSSIGSSVNSYEESGSVVDSNINANIYADIEIGDEKCGFATNKHAMCDLMPPELPASNATPKQMLVQVPTISECENFEECVEVTEDDLLKIPGIEYKLNCSKNNLLLIDDQLMTATSIDNHLNNIELINKNLDKLMEAHQAIDNDDKDDESPSEIKAEKIKLKKKIAEKINILKQARMMSPSTSDATAKESLKTRMKNIFPKFERQSSQEGQENVENKQEKSKPAKGFLSSFKRKPVEPTVLDETDEDFEEIKKVLIDISQVTDLDDGSKVKGENSSSKFKNKFKFKSTKKLIGPNIGSTPTLAETENCRQCFKKRARFLPNKATSNSDNAMLRDIDFCVCVNVDELFDVNGVCIRNIEYKDVSLHDGFILA